MYKCVCGEILEFLTLGKREICPGCHEEYIARMMVGRVKKKKVRAE
jgi:hypothetical protein